MTSLNDVLLAMSNIPVDDPIAEIWGRGLQGGYEIIEYTGTLPITINADGNALLDYKIYGNTVQDGTPTPEAPVDVVGCGVETENLWDISRFSYIGEGAYNIDDTTVTMTGSSGAVIYYLTWQEYEAGTYTFTFERDMELRCYYVIVSDFPLNNCKLDDDQLIMSATVATKFNKSYAGYRGITETSFNITSDVPFYFAMAPSQSFYTISNIMLTRGSTALPYEPYGYKLPMTVSDGSTKTTTPVYIGDTPLGEDEYVDYGEQKVYKRKTLKDIGDTVSVNGDLWDIVNYNNDFTRATLLRHETMPDMAYGAKQAIYAFPNGLAAGDYHFTIAEHPWVAGDVGKTLTFTLTQAIPDGGQLVLNVAYNKTLVGATISSYASPTTTTAIETVTMTEGDSGTDLGSLTNAGTPASNINSLRKALLGSNEWKTSAQRQYLNSDNAAGSVWIPQTIFDRPPVWAINTAGFMNGLGEDFLSCVADTTYVTVRNAISDGGGTDTLTDKFYLPSRTEIFGDNEIANTPEGTLYQYYVNATNADRIKYRANTARSWRLRTPAAIHAHYVHSVYTTGALNNQSAYVALGFAPACQIDLTKLNNSWILANFYKPTLTPTDPPVPLPALPTIDGTTTIDCELADKPSQMYIKYRR